MQITENIHALRIPFQIPVGPGRILDRFVYSYLVPGSTVCLIDSGVKGSETLIFDYLAKLGRKPEEVSLLILTHAHPDHIGAAGVLAERTGCRVAAHAAARKWIEDVELQYSQRPVPGFHTLVGPGPQVGRILQDGEIIDLDKLSLEVIHTPGHSSGSISLYCREDGVLFSGDAIPHAADLPIYEDAAASVESINRLKNIPEIKFLLASWAEPLTGSGAYKMIDDSLEYLQKIHTAIREIAGKQKISEPMELCARTVAALGLPEIAVNQLIAKSFASHLNIIDQAELG